MLITAYSIAFLENYSQNPGFKRLNQVESWLNVSISLLLLYLQQFLWCLFSFPVSFLTLYGASHLKTSYYLYFKAVYYCILSFGLLYL